MKRKRIKNPAPPASDLEKTLPNPFKEMEVVLRELANDETKKYPQIVKDTMSGLFLKEEEHPAAAAVWRSRRWFNSRINNNGQH